MQIFINEYIDLCSDDDDDDDVDTTKQNDDGHSSRKPRQSADSDDDLEIVSVSYPEKQKSAPAKSKETNGKKPDRCSNATSTMVRETKDIVIDALDATSSELLRQIDKFSIEEFKFADPHNYHANSDGDDEEKLFKRRNHELFKRRDVSVTGVKECTNQEASYNKAKERNSRRGQVSPSSLLDAISLDSSDEETSQIHRSAEVSSLANTAEKLGCKEIIGNSKMLTTNEKHRHSNEKLQSRPDLTSIKTKTTQCDLNNGIDNASNQNANIALTNPSISKSTDLTSIEDLSVEQLMSCTVANDERKSVNLEKLLIQLIQKLMQKTSSEPDSAPLSSMMQDTSSSAATLPPNPNNLHPTARTQVYQNNQAPSSTYNCQNSSALPPTTDGHSPFQMLANQRRLNLNDPRIRNELNKYKNSPLLAAGGIDISNLCNSVPTQTTLPIPYGQANPLNHPPIVNRGPSRLPTVVDPHTPASSYRQPLSQNYRLPQQYAMPNNMRHSHSNTTKSSITYAEYKRRKAEEQQRIAERQRQEITARSGTNVQPRPPNYHNIQTETENTSKEYMDKIEMQKRTEEIRSVLLQTLQPYTEKIEAMWESRNNRPTQDIPLNGDENPNTTTNPAIHLNAVNSNSLENNLNNMDKSKSIENEPIHSRPENQDLSKDPLENANPLSEPMNKEPPPHKSKETAKYKNSTHTSNGAIKNDKVTRLLKSLDYSTRDAEHGNMPKTIGLKRRSSIHARTAISRQLNAECTTRDNGDADSSSSTTKHQVSPPQPNITKRRKTIDDMPKTLLRKRRQSINTTPASVATALQNEQEKGEEEVQNKTNTEEVLRECAGSDSDLNDFEKFRMAKIQKLKDISSIGQPLIVLQRLTDCEIRNYSRCEENTQTTEENNNNTLSVLLVESKSHPANQDIVVDNGKKIATAKGKKVKPTKLNNNCKMTEANTRLCVLCSTRPADLTNHYVLRHKTESYVSRLTQHQIDDLSLNTPFAQELSNPNGRLIRYTVTCAFCKEELCESFMNLYNHYATHTGEYAFRCSGCKLDKPFRADIQSHQLHSRKCRGSSVLTMYRYPSSNMVIYLHYCTICNFVQLNEANVLKHLRDHHDNHQSTSANNIQKCILAAIRDGRSDNIKSSDPATPSGSSREYKDSVDCHKSNAKTEMEEVVAMSIDDHIPVENEAVAEEQHQSTMYSSLEDQLKQMHSDITCISPMTVIHCSSSSSKPIEDALESRNGMESIQGYSYVCKSEPIDDFEADRCLINICKSEPIDEDDDRPPTPPRPSLQKFTAKRYLPKYRLYPENVKYLGLYKCLWDDCYFSTDTKAEFIQHLEDHRSEHASELHLNCAYCNHFEEQLCASSNQLAEHINEEHLHMIYQCSACCYRSCEASNVLIHQEVSHTSNIQSCVIYKCSGIERTVDDNYIHNKMMGNVGKLPCTSCSHKSFYHTLLLDKHLKMEHNIYNVQQQQHFSCIYCPISEKNDGLLRKHLALYHPNELPYVCDHNDLAPGNEDLLENLKTICLMKTVPFIDVNTSDHKPEDVKPNAEDLVKLHEETVKVRLHKLTQKTGVSPDLLFRCAEKSCGGFFSNFDLWLSHMRSRHHSLECNCPHCPTESAHSLTDYRKHFEQHRRHTYLCFHCPLTFARQQDVETHFSNSHKSLGDTMRMERFRFNISYSYFVAIQKDMLPTRSEFVLTLLGTLNRNLKELEENENQSFKRTWSASPQSANWLSEYTNSVSGSSSFFICGACFNYYDCRRDLSDHIRENHVARDVPVVSVKKSNQDTYHHTLELSFAKECVTFSTMRNCFCCEERDMRGDAFILHLKRHHKFVLHYFCDWCDLAITSLDFVDSHFKQCHVASNLKMRCQLTHKEEVLLVSLEDFRVQIPPTEKYSNISAVVKEEPQDNSNIDSSVMLLENDDIFLEDHSKYLESVADYSPKPRLKCISLKSLLKPTPPPSTIIPQNIQVVTSVRDPSLSSRKQFLQPKYQTTSGCGNLVLSTTSSNTIVPYIAKTTCAIQSTSNHLQIQSSTQNVQLLPMVDISANSSTATMIYPTQPGNESRYVAVPINRATITTSSYQSNPYQTLTTSFLNTHLNASTSASYVHNPIHPMYISSGEMKTLPSSNAVYGRVSSYDAMNTDRSS